MSKTEIVLNKSDAVVGKVVALDDNELAEISGGVHVDSSLLGDCSSENLALGANWDTDLVAGTGKRRKIDS